MNGLTCCWNCKFECYKFFFFPQQPVTAKTLVPKDVGMDKEQGHCRTLSEAHCGIQAHCFQRTAALLCSFCRGGLLKLKLRQMKRCHIEKKQDTSPIISMEKPCYI